MHRLYVPDLPEEGALTTLPDEEAKHLTQVLRLTIGDAVRVFDGRGREHDARVEQAARHRAEVRIGPAHSSAAEASSAITLAAALLKGDKFDDVVRNAVMLGAVAIQPLVTAHTDVPAGRTGGSGRVDRWRRIALSSTKQCGRAVLADVASPERFAEALGRLPRPWLVLVEPSAVVGVIGSPPPPPHEATVFVGPEGGWSAAELATLEEEGAIFLQLGARTLRADAVPLVALTVLLYEWDCL